MIACMFGTYDREHSANRVLRTSLVDGGFTVRELHEPLWETTRSKEREYFGARSVARLGVGYLRAARRLRRRWRQTGGPPPLVVVGFGGHLDVLLAARLCRPRVGLVFAPLVSLTETLVADRRAFAAGSLRARGLAVLDRATLRAPDLVLADTAAHAAYLRALAGAPIPVEVFLLGVEPEFLAPPPPVERQRRRVLVYGRCLPLHGIDTIVAAAARLGDRAEFVLIGRGPERARLEALSRELRAPVTWRDDVPLGQLPAELAAAAVVLGVFGAGEKAAMVVPNKVWQAAAAGRPLVTRDGPALREVLEPGVHCLACPPDDPERLAAAIVGMLDDPVRAEELGGAARRRVVEAFGPAARARRLASSLRSHFGTPVR